MTLTASIVVCTHNRAVQLAAMLQTMTRLCVQDLVYELVLVDNASTDATRQVAQQFASRLPLRYLYEPRRGKSFALNLACDEASGDLLVFTDDDVLLTEAWLASFVSAARRRADAACFQGRVLNRWDCPIPAWLAVDGPFQLRGVIANCDLGDLEYDLRPVKFVGANAAVRRDALHTTGPFRTDMGPGHATAGLNEDTDLAMRLEDVGIRCVYLPEATVYHPVPGARATQAYFRRWAEAAGRSQAKIYAPSYRVSPTLFGLPRYVVRRYLEHRLRQLGHALAGNRQASFYFKVRSWELAAALREVRSWRAS